MKFKFFCLLLIFASAAFTQTEEVLTRKIIRFENAQKGICEKYKSLSAQKDSVFAIIEKNRIELAPNCPISFLDPTIQTRKEELIKNWYLNFPEEYRNYVIFLEKHIRFNTL